MKKLSRRTVLRGLGGAALALPFLESLRSPRTAAAAPGDNSFAIFFRQANGVAAAQNTDEIGAEPERFWPTEAGALTAATVAGRALDELDGHLGNILAVRGVNMESFNYGDGHARGALQGLTARGPTVEGAAGDSEAAGESIDHRIGAELNDGGRDSLFLYAGKGNGWLGGPCISYRGSGTRRTALHDPQTAYETMVGGDTGLSPEARAELIAKRRSVNDLVRGQLSSLMSRPELSKSDSQRIELHLDSVRDVEVALSCKLAADKEAAIAGIAPAHDSDDGRDVVRTVKLHMDIAAIAVACGYTRSVAIQVGSGNDGSTRYLDVDTGQLMSDNFHYVSHRRQSHGADGSIIPGSDYLHHKIDRQFAQMFKHLLDRLAELDGLSGPLLDDGIAVWYNDNGNGPGHSPINTPWIIGGSAGGFLETGQFIDLGTGWGDVNHSQMLNTLASAVGVRKSDGSYLDDFGDPSLPKGLMSEIVSNG